jgi:voltage-gated potassium channel
MDSFIEYYGIEGNSNNYNIWLGMYYMYTTLSTVGFGDLAPRSDPERAICAVILMMGVSIFSIFLGDMTTIIDAYK